MRLDSGADVNEQDGNGASLFMCAALRGDIALARLLPTRGADVHKRGIILIDRRDGGGSYGSAAAEAEGYKPGPMGNPGLRQLSYDEGMPILVATQATDSAWAERYSLLMQALAQEGIGEKQMGLNEVLRYAEEPVPALYEEKIGTGEKKKIQEPKLFEFKR
jgi:hypothetical protein